jgi:hypothetical protein
VSNRALTAGLDKSWFSLSGVSAYTRAANSLRHWSLIWSLMRTQMAPRELGQTQRQRAQNPSRVLGAGPRRATVRRQSVPKWPASSRASERLCQPTRAPRLRRPRHGTRSRRLVEYGDCDWERTGAYGYSLFCSLPASPRYRPRGAAVVPVNASLARCR